MLRPSSSLASGSVEPVQTAQTQAVASQPQAKTQASETAEHAPLHEGNGGLEGLRELGRVNPALVRLVNREERAMSPSRTGSPIQRVQNQDAQQIQHTEGRADVARVDKPVTKSRFDPAR